MHWFSTTWWRGGGVEGWRGGRGTGGAPCTDPPPSGGHEVVRVTMVMIVVIEVGHGGHDGHDGHGGEHGGKYDGEHGDLGGHGLQGLGRRDVLGKLLLGPPAGGLIYFVIDF